MEVAKITINKTGDVFTCSPLDGQVFKNLYDMGIENTETCIEANDWAEISVPGEIFEGKNTTIKIIEL